MRGTAFPCQDRASAGRDLCGNLAMWRAGGAIAPFYSNLFAEVRNLGIKVSNDAYVYVHIYIYLHIDKAIN